MARSRVPQGREAMTRAPSTRTKTPTELREIVRKHKAGIKRLTVEYPLDLPLAPEDVEQVRRFRRALGLCALCGMHPARQFCRFDPKRRDEDALPLAPKTAAQMRRAASKARYAASPKGRAVGARYAASAKGRARSASYNRSEGGRRRAIKHNRTARGRARTLRFEATPHRREYKALSYLFGTPYRDLDVAAVLSVNRALPSWGPEHLKTLKFKSIKTRCAHCVAQGKKNLLPMGTRLIPIKRREAESYEGVGA